MIENNNIRSPSNFVVCWFLFFLIILNFLNFNTINAFADVNTTSTVISDTVQSFNDNVNYVIKNYKDNSQIVEALYYTSSPVRYNKDTSGATVLQFSYIFDITDIASKTSRVVRSNWGSDVTVYASSRLESGLGLESYECTFKCARLNNVVEGSDIYSPVPQYDINNLNDYPMNTINVVSPLEKIKTNSKYYTFSFKGKIKLEENDIEENVTPQIISKFIRNKFRYDFKNSNENLTGLSSLGAFKINKDDSFKDEVMLQNLLDGKVSFNNEKYEVTDSVDDFVCGVGGNYKSWNSKGYYNFVVNTSVYVGDSPGTNEYKFYFTVPYKFKGIFSYKTITVNYSLERNVYADDNFDCIDDETSEVIPPEEVEIIHPDYVFPSTSTPSGSNTFNDGDVVQNNNNNVLVNNGSDVSQEEHNGILNMLDNGLRTTTGRLKSLGVSLFGFKDSMNGLFSFLPEDVSNLFFVGISLTVVFFILGLRRR